MDEEKEIKDAFITNILKLSHSHLEEYQKKLAIAKMAYKKIIDCFEEIQSCTEYEIGFCWDECIHVDDILFHYYEMKDKENG